MKPIKQAVCWGCFYRDTMKPEEYVKVVKDTGFQAIDFAPEEHYPLIKDAGLEISLAIGHGTLRDGMNKRENHDRIEEELLKSLETAEKFGIRNLCCFSGDRHFAIDDLVGTEICAEIMARVAPVAEAKGVNLTMELLSSRDSHPGYMCDRTGWGVHMCKMSRSPRVKLLYDIFHMQSMEGDHIRTIRANISWISHFHTAGHPGRRDLDDQQEIYYPAIARAVAELDFDGFVAHEYSPKGDPIGSMKAAYRTWLVE